ncbi:GcrA family cell cycle regulator [Enterovirga sp.]|jgi:GcrA cell cycle regulator|uniref:GcrA family cell cycle regulator n=1 Tax=Enterovirga sp. TaxID=2026350 RepID=UPI0026209CD6|nr:GcrA family cell cycle regulator [Enterovirga sp.]MDB5590369.1 GcrA cell cycle regulator [Enterovirga sp.]
MADAAAGWTEDRVELLGRLWGEGLSASQIAALLGGGVTRNAVIGKVHRLGLSGRGKAGQPAPPRAPKPRPQAVPEAVPGVAPVGLGEASPVQEAAVAVRRAEPAMIPVSERVSILDLRDSMCRWPLGDPATADFGFCGARSITGLPYCGTHCQIAYQPAAERKRLRA